MHATPPPEPAVGGVAKHDLDGARAPGLPEDSPAKKVQKQDTSDDAPARGRSVSSANSAKSMASGHDAAHYADIADTLEAQLNAAKLQKQDDPPKNTDA